jgi:hypothetical protein
MVDKYGMPMLSDINNGSFVIPKYNMSSPVNTKVDAPNAKEESSGSVYNTYSVSVQVPNAQVSADEVADKVMYKLKTMNNGSVRSYRGF